MPKMNLLEGVVWRGRLYGPGEVELPNEPALLERVGYFEEVTRVQAQHLVEDALRALPSGHPYRTMFQVASMQPVASEEPARSTGAAIFRSVGLDPVAANPDGFSVSGLGLAQAPERGESVPNELVQQSLVSSLVDGYDVQRNAAPTPTANPNDPAQTMPIPAEARGNLAAAGADQARFPVTGGAQVPAARPLASAPEGGGPQSTEEAPNGPKNRK